jgi:hypothetical protein
MWGLTCCQDGRAPKEARWENDAVRRRSARDAIGGDIMASQADMLLSSTASTLNIPAELLFASCCATSGAFGSHSCHAVVFAEDGRRTRDAFNVATGAYGKDSTHP